MEYDHAHSDSEIFKEGSEWRPKVQTLGDYIAKKHPYPCVVIGTEIEEVNGTERPNQAS